MKVQIVLGDKTYVADVAAMFHQMTIGQIRAIRRETGMTSHVLQHKVLELADKAIDKPGDAGDENWDVYTALVFLVLSRSDWHVTWADVERIPLVDIANGWSVIKDDPVEDVPLGDLAVIGG